jgi:hypothetical protein
MPYGYNDEWDKSKVPWLQSRANRKNNNRPLKKPEEKVEGQYRPKKSVESEKDHKKKDENESKSNVLICVMYVLCMSNR